MPSTIKRSKKAACGAVMVSCPSYCASYQLQLLVAPHSLSPAEVVGLLSASCGCSLLATTFANNSGLVKRGVLAMVNVLSRQIETKENNRPGSLRASESASTGKPVGGGGGPLAREISGSQFLRACPAFYFIVLRSGGDFGAFHFVERLHRFWKFSERHWGTLAEMVLHGVGDFP